MDDLDVASDDRELELITGVHERASSPLSRPHSFPASNSSPASETSEMHRRKPVRPAVEILPDEWDGIEQHESSLESARSTGIAGAGAENVPCKNGYADWGDVADDQLSLEELQVEADEVTAAIEDAFPSGKPPLGRATPLKSVCADKPRLQKRMRDITAELANVQMATAGWAADAEGSIGSGDEKKDDRLLRDEVGRLRITLNHLTRLTLERAFEVRDAIDAHR
ncbi:unnamed protein product [Chondrus crispus]|uniref:Uncharacterized protein n=1 Tax=Chondrus crispus TaxID=2769 RepID=R7Q938_CHOCR|nr:unnamed protein product [Chondrus crispus]CDF35027.1 unnamed protein product [Chondrus crispus]|eukprot:XP_005714846.1 unnamed protein product [Chondrus crispus]